MTTTTFEILTALESAAKGETVTLPLDAEAYPASALAGTASTVIAEVTVGAGEPHRSLRLHLVGPSRKERVAALGTILEHLLHRAMGARGHEV
jgi:hypothetical protein